MVDGFLIGCNYPTRQDKYSTTFGSDWDVHYLGGRRFAAEIPRDDKESMRKKLVSKGRTLECKSKAN